MSRRQLPKTDLGRFNDKMDEFLDKLGKCFPDDPDIPFYGGKIYAARKMNARLLVEQFMESIGPFQSKIEAKDESFFVDELDYEKMIGEFEESAEQKSEYIRLAQKIRTLWLDGMTDNTKEQVWKYFQVFIILGNRIVGSQ